jgi:hypothetical protein
MGNPNNQQVSRAGEHFVAAELHRRGAYAVTFAGNMPRIDILATNTEQTHTAAIQVKTMTARTWQTSITPGRKMRGADQGGHSLLDLRGAEETTSATRLLRRPRGSRTTSTGHMRNTWPSMAASARSAKSRLTTPSSDPASNSGAIGGICSVYSPKVDPYHQGTRPASTDTRAWDPRALLPFAGA